MTDQPLPGHEQQPADITCSSCGRFVGALTRCPHCGARVTKRLSVRMTRHAAVLLATVGLGLLYLMAVNKEAPTIKIGDIKPTMNFAYVRVEGRISSDPRIFKQGGRVKSVRFDLDDGTGEMPVTAYAAQANELVDTKKIPGLGDQVSVAGTLSVAADDRILMRLQSPKQMTITRAELPVTPIGQIGAEGERLGVVVEGVLTDVRTPRPGSRAPWSVKVQDDSGSVEVSFWEDVYADLADKAQLAPGARVRIRASVGSYRGQLQLRLANGRDLEVLEAGSSVPAGRPRAKTESLTLGEVTAEMEGQLVETEGAVVELSVPDEGSKAPHRIVLEDGDARLVVVYWDTVADRLGTQAPVVGARLQVRGQVGRYRDETQIKVTHPGQITNMGISSSPASEETFSDPTPVKDLSQDRLGQTVTVQGVLGDPRSLRQGVVFPLTDESGTTSIVLWDRNVPGSARDQLRAGIVVTVAGKLGEYKGELQVVPSTPRSVRFESDGGEAP